MRTQTGEAGKVLIGLGANIGDPLVQLRRAVDSLRELVRVDAVSSVYHSEPVGFRDQPDFFNLVCRACTELTPEVLLQRIRTIERELGRERSFPNAPRTIDIDLLDHSGLLVDTGELILPHPRLHQRAFVLVPLAEIAPDWRHPRLGRTAAELLARGPLEKIALWGPLPDLP